MELEPAAYRDLVRRALEEDIGAGDVTTLATISPVQRARGVFLAKSPCVLSGGEVALEAFRQLEPAVEAAFFKKTGEWCRPGEEIGSVNGLARTLLTGERTALNFLQRLCGIATRTRHFVDAAGGRIIVLDTRKTTPTLRVLEKAAVVAGGAVNHRMGLHDAILIKDNHVRLAGGVGAAVTLVRRENPGMAVEIEAQTLDEVDQSIAAGAEVILADNMSIDEIRETVRRAAGRVKIEISGGVTLERMAALATTGADFVSVGDLTHSAPAADISFEITPAGLGPGA